MGDTRVDTPLTEREQAVWRAFARAAIVVPRVLENELIAEQNLTVSEYRALVHLSEAPGHRLRMSDLADRSDLSLSGMTRIVSRLASEGLVLRARCTEDARGAFAVLTDAGVARLAEAYPSHVAGVRRHVLDHLDGIDLEALTCALSRFGVEP